MISELTPAATLPTKNVSRARKFYEETLGLSVTNEYIGGIFYRCGDGMIFLYESQYAGTNKATAVTFGVDDSKFDREVEGLRKKGVSFLTFEYEGMKWDGDVAYTEDGMRAVWFTDPDGNIINIGSMPV